MKPWTDWSYTDGTFDFDSDKLAWPIYRDWTGEAAHLCQVIVRCKAEMIMDEQTRDQEDEKFKYSHSLQELVNAERQYQKLLKEFRVASVYVVHLIIKRNPTPLNLFNLLGDEGEKYVSGGIYVRRAQGWQVAGQQFSTYENEAS